MSSKTKDTIYIDVDDDITSIIDKVAATPNKIVALVLPKRAASLHSIVNMKLLKKTSHDMDKRLVLITSESSLLPLAGVVGLHVAKTLQSKPAIPPAPDMPSSQETMEDDNSDSDANDDVELDATKPVGELAGANVSSDETIEMEDTEEADKPASDDAKPKSKDRKNKIKIPNFESFRLRLILAGLAVVVLVVGYAFGFVILPKARVVVRTDNKTISSRLDFSLNTAATEIDLEKSILPAVSQEVSKTDTISISASGQKNVGDKAKGTVQIYNCSKDDKLSDTSRTVPAGTGVSSGGLTYILDASVTVEPSSYVGNVCQSNKPSAKVAVTAQGGGEQYNLDARSYAVAGFSTMTASGSAMTGGTNKNVTIVSQQDVENAKTQVADQSKVVAIEDLKKSITDAGLIAVESTINGADPTVTPSPAVGEEATTVTVTSVRKYTMLGVKEEDLKQLIDAEAKKEVDLDKQPIVDYGIKASDFKVISSRSAADQSISVQINSVAGVKIEPDAIKEEVKGKKRGEAVTIVESHPGVQSVEVNFSPPWVSKIPGNTSKVTVFFEQANTDTGDENQQ